MCIRDRDTAVVHDGSQAGGRPLAREDMSNVSSASIAGRLGTDSIATSKIAGGALPTDVTIASANFTSGQIVNSHVNASAAIAGTKISPDFGSQNIDTTGTLDALSGVNTSGTLTITSTQPRIHLVDSDNNDDFSIYNNHGQFLIYDSTDGASRFTIASDGTTGVLGNLDVGSGVDVTGNMTVTGTVDGRDVAADGTKLDGIATSANNYSHPNHSGEVTSSGDGATTIADNVVDEANLKVSNSPTNGYYLQAQSGNTGGLTWAAVPVTDFTSIASNVVPSGSRTLGLTGTRWNNIYTSYINVTNEMAITTIQANSGEKLRLNNNSGVGIEFPNGSNDILPTHNNATDLGSSSKKFDNIYATTLYGDGSNLTGVQPFPSGTKMLFQQTAAPTGWTKVTSGVDNKALRVVSGTAGSGGSNAFSNTLASRGITANAANTTAGGNITVASATTGGTVDNHTLSTNEIPSHNHELNDVGNWYGGNNSGQPKPSSRLGNQTTSQNVSTQSTGGGGAHSHGFTGGSHNHNATFTGTAHNHSITVTNLDMAVQYLDVIIAQKD